MVHAEITREEHLIGDDGKPYPVFTVSLRLGMKRWQIRRKYAAFRQLEALLRTNYAEASTLALGALPLPKDPPPGTTEHQIVAEFLVKLVGSAVLIDTSPTRQFLEVPSSRAILDLSNDPTRSILSAPLHSLVFKNWSLDLPPQIPARTDLADVLMVATALVTALPLFFGIPEVTQPLAAAWAAVVSAWYAYQPDGLFDIVLGIVWGKDNVPFAREFVRPADMPAVAMFVGALVGYGLGSPVGGARYATALATTRFFVMLALSNLVYLDLKALAEAEAEKRARKRAAHSAQ